MKQVRLLLEMGKPRILALLSLVTLAGAALAPGFFADPPGSLLRAAVATLVTALLWLGVALLNDLADAPIDRISNPDRPLPSGRVTPRTVWRWALASLGAALLLTFLTGSPTAWMLALCGLALGAAYSLPPLRLRRIGPLANLVIGAGVALAALGGQVSQMSLSTQAARGPFPPDGLLSAAVLGLLATATSMVKDFKDVAGDSAGGIRTLPAVLGFRQAVQVNLAVVALAYGSAIWILAQRAGSLLLPVLILALPLLLNLALLSRLLIQSDVATARRVYQGVVLLFMGVTILYVAATHAFPAPVPAPDRGITPGRLLADVVLSIHRGAGHAGP